MLRRFYTTLQPLKLTATIAARCIPAFVQRNLVVKMSSTSASEPVSEASASASRRIRVYTRTGDKGTSSLYNGERRPKDDVTFDALGAVDELNAHLGLAREYIISASLPILDQVEEIQSRLLDVGSAIATPASSSSPEHLARVEFSAEHASHLEQWIDKLDDELPPLKNFILPSGGLASSQLHVARTVCRRAERKVFALAHEGHVGNEVAQYLNRLSDYLFVAARYAAMKAGATELVYKKSKGITERSLS